MLKIYGVKYDGFNTDFENLMNNEQFKNSLFIFNDNQSDHYSCKKGLGNAKMRIYNKYSHYEYPKSAGIPTGYYRHGYSTINESREDIDNSFNEIIELLLTEKYDSIVYSIHDYTNPLIGTGIFDVGIEVRKYITKRILEFSKNGEYFSVSNKYGILGPVEITDEIINLYV